MQTRLEKFLVIIEAEVKKAERVYREAKKSASEVAASAALSPSQAGDRFHSQNASDLAKQRLGSLKKLEAEVKSGSARYIVSGKEGFFLVKNIALIQGVKMVSADSPVGRKLKNVE